jgi:hypothetical protein
MHPQLQQIHDDYDGASRRLQALAGRVPDGAWFARPEPARWSPGENVAHLSITTTKFLPLIRDGLGRAPRLPSTGSYRYHRDPVGWLLWHIMLRQGLRVKTPASFVRGADGSPAGVLEEFARHQAEMLECLAAADGHAIDKIKIVSAIDNRARYNLFACFGILARHQHRHLWQAEQALEATPTRRRS